jgi:hypothetical protein
MAEDRMSRAGKAWSSKEDAELRNGFDQQETLKKLAECHERSTGAIIARVVHLGMTVDRDEAREIFASRIKKDGLESSAN